MVSGEFLYENPRFERGADFDTIEKAFLRVKTSEKGIE